MSVRSTSESRINVVGSPGSGKTYFSRRFSEAHSIPYFRMDDVAKDIRRKGDWVDYPSLELTLLPILETDKWLIDGFYQSSIELRFSHSNIIIFLDLPLSVCLFRAFKRSFLNLIMIPTTTHAIDRADARSRIRYFLNPGMLFRIIRFHKRRKNWLMKLLEQHSKTQTVILIRNNSQMSSFMQESLVKPLSECAAAINSRFSGGRFS